MIRLCALSLVLTFASVTWAQSPPIGAVVQTMDYDAARKVTTAHIVNISHKEISALSLSVRVMFPGGTLSSENEFGVDFVDGIIQGKGGFAPGVILNQEIPQAGPVQATLDMVVYSDGTAEVLNNRPFKELIAGRKARVNAWQKINELLNNALSDPNEQHPTATVLAQLKGELAATSQHPGEGGAFYGSEIKDAIQNVTNLLKSHRLTEPAFEGNELRALIKTHEGRISGMSPHTELVKAGVQP